MLSLLKVVIAQLPVNLLSSENGYAVLNRTVSVSARNRRIIYGAKHINSYL
jgi:hypothetical protein